MDRAFWIQCFIIACSFVDFSESFNIDVENVLIYQQENGSSFGYKAEFFQEANLLRLLVAAPKKNNTGRSNSGFFYSCDPTRSSRCMQRKSPAEAETAGKYAQPLNHYSEENEQFGLAMTVADPKTAVICGPMWSDLRYWSHKYIFTVGRCEMYNRSRTFQSTKPFFAGNPTMYTGRVTLSGYTSVQMVDGASQFGFSAAGDGEGKVVLGAPGFSVSRGTVVVLDTKTAEAHTMRTILDQDPDILLGYEVAVGNFCGKDRFCFVTSNRQVKGKVYLLQHEPDSRVPFQVIWSTTGDQVYSSFGSVLCAADVNGDGWADLLVGAPTYTASLNESHTYDEGRVFVYISHGEAIAGQANFNKPVALNGDGLQLARFGSAIASIGDINRDSINDVAVGAPLEEDGAGALYVYLGSPSGLGPKYSQKIRGKGFTPPLATFGSHISRPTSSLSSYNYPDFAVGAPESDTVVILKTRLIINAEIKVQATPNPVDPANSFCPQPEHRGRPCVNVTMCLGFDFRATSQDDQIRDIDLQVNMDMDSLVDSDASRRIRLLNPLNNALLTSYSTEFRVRRGLRSCVSYWAVLDQNKIDRNPFVPVKIHASFSLNSTVTQNTVAPILNQSMPNSHTEHIKFQNKCGEDSVCKTDLALSGRVLHVPPLVARYPFNVVNHTTQVELQLDLVNNKEISFGFRLSVNITGQIEYNTATGNTSITCDVVVDSVLHCRSWAPVAEGAHLKIRLQFLAHTVPLEAPNKVIRFNVKVTPYVPQENPEVNMADNVLSLESRTAIVSDLLLNGWSDPKQIHVQDSDQGDLTLNHKLLVVNRGPSYLPATKLLVYLPFKDSAGSDILGASNVTIKQADGTTVECPRALDTGGSTDDDSSTTIITTTTTTQPPSTTTPKTTPTGSTDNPFGDIDANRRRRRRAAEAEAGPGSKAKVKAAPLNRTVNGQQVMDCVTYSCRAYKCPLSSLRLNDKADINITLTLLRSAITFPQNVDTLLYVTRTHAVRPHHPLFYPWDKKREREVKTSIKKVSSADDINIWIIIGGVIGGLLLLILIAILAYKLGFFKRKNKEKLENLKRENGFYETSRNSTRSKGSQRASTRSQRASNSGT